MRGRRFSIGLRAALAIFTVIVLVTNTWAAANWNEKVLHNFAYQDGAYPHAGLIFDAAGNLYGTTSTGGALPYGTVFELTPTAGGGWTETVLHNFNWGGRVRSPRWRDLRYRRQSLRHGRLWRRLRLPRRDGV